MYIILCKRKTNKHINNTKLSVTVLQRYTLVETVKRGYTHVQTQSCVGSALYWYLCRVSLLWWCLLDPVTLLQRLQLLEQTVNVFHLKTTVDDVTQ